MVVVPQGVVSGYRSGGRQAKSSLSSGHEVKIEQRKKGGWGGGGGKEEPQDHYIKLVHQR